VDVRAAKTSRVRLDGGEVHLWWGRRDAAQELGSLPGWLSDDERRRGERFRRAEDARAFLFRRVFRRAVLARYVGVAPAELVFEAGAHGKPFLAAPHASVRFNASSSGEWVLVAVSVGRELGVDVERGGERFLGVEELSLLARRVLTRREQDALRGLPESARPRAFLRAWTRKEAVLKALGTGLSREPDTLEVGLEPWACATELEGLHALDLEAPPGSAASLASAGTAGLQKRPGKSGRGEMKMR
jgi:4'-phosphopantetheinyl transferase